MKLLYGNGSVLEVRNVSEVIYRIRAGNNIPIKFNGYRILEDDAAREALKDVLELGYHEGEKVET